MNQCILAVSLAFSALPAIAAEECRFIHESNPNFYIVEGDGELIVRDEGKIGMAYTLEALPDRPLIGKATFIQPNGSESSFLYRFIESNGERILIADMDVYFASCGEFKLPPA